MASTTTPSLCTVIAGHKIVGPADSFGFQVIAGEGVGAGAWMYHCHVQSHADMGMAGLFLVRRTDPRALSSGARPGLS